MRECVSEMIASGPSSRPKMRNVLERVLRVAPVPMKRGYFGASVEHESLLQFWQKPALPACLKG